MEDCPYKTEMEDLTYKAPRILLPGVKLPRKKSTRNINIEILDKLQEIKEKLGILEDRLTSIEKRSHLSLEDQLFFGLVFSLFILFITFPSTTDMIEFFEAFELVHFPVMLTYGIKLMLITTLFLSSGLRYYGAIRKSQLAISISVKALLIGIYGFVLEIAYIFPGSFIFQILGEKMLLLVSSLIITLLALGLGVVEKAILDFYKTIGQIEKPEHSMVEASIMFLFFGVGSMILSLGLFVIEIFWVVPPSFITSVSVLVMSYVISFLIIFRNRMKIDSMYEKICERLRFRKVQNS